MATKVLLFILLSGSDSNLAASRFRHIGWSGDEVDWVGDLLGSLGVSPTVQCRGVRAFEYEPLTRPKTNRL